MPEPSNFPESNMILEASEIEYRGHIGPITPLPTWSDGEQSVSSWKLSFRERLSALIFGRVWLSVLSGRSQPPVSLTVHPIFFAHPAQEEK